MRLPRILLCSLLLAPVFTARPANADSSVTFSASKDAFLRNGARDTNEGANTFLSLRAGGKRRSLIAFDLTSLPTTLTGHTLTSATLRLYVTFNGHNWSKQGRDIAAHRLLDDWTEGNGVNASRHETDASPDEVTKNRGTGSGVTWNCATDTNIHNSRPDCAIKWKGGNYASLATSTVRILNTTKAQFVEFDVTADVNAYLSNTATNFGWLIKKVLISRPGVLRFASREATANQPELVVNYQ